MKRFKKDEMLDVISILIASNDTIDNLLENNVEGVSDVLVKCQESAILIGTYIETLGDKYSYVVKTLEEYCENLYQMSIILSDGQRCKKIIKAINKQLTQLSNNILYDLPPDRKEVVFLPYKASMWDSLESVWKVADEDPDTDAYVIPIPYYDKNTDGSFKEEHYEGGLFPDYVPVKKYDEYDFEERKPEIIFIHNPYDDGNLVTSVHPFFYSKNLKQFTDKLVYIPYFVLEEMNFCNKDTIEELKHFIMVPGVINANKVIVQSENMRQVYIEVLTEATGNNKNARMYWERIIDGTGSPKYDKVVNTKIGDVSIPGEWSKLITKTDGSLKKILFYNTSINALLKYNDRMLEKMKNVFDYFSHNNDVVLLWRPHPLLNATIQSMRSDLKEEYDRIVTNFKSKKMGIYDDSADLNRAIAISNGYYGDASSVVWLFAQVGKLVMIQSVDICEY